MSLKTKVSVVTTLAVAAVAMLAYRSLVPTVKERKEHMVEVTVAFSPSPRVTEDQFVTVYLTVNNHDDRPLPVNQSPWQRTFPAETGDLISVTGRQSGTAGTISCRIKVDGEERDHDITKPHQSHITCLEVL